MQKGLRDSWCEPAHEVYAWIRSYCSEYPGVPKDLGPQHFGDGKLLTYMLHRSVPDAVILAAMESMTSKERVTAALDGAKRHLAVEASITAERVQDPNAAEFLLLTYLSSYRARVTQGLQLQSGNQTATKPAPKEGRFGTLRAAPSMSKTSLETISSGPEHVGVLCPICEGALDNRGLLVKVMPDKIVYHAACFNCRICKAPFASCYWPYNLVPYCLPHYLVASGMICSACKSPIQENAVMVHGAKLHSSCFVCAAPQCGREFADSYNLHQGKPYCDVHYKELAGVTCSSCGLAVSEKAVKALGGIFHRDCFRCFRCDSSFLRPDQKPLPFLAMAGKALCVPCHEAMLGSPANRCGGCKKELVPGQCVSAMGSNWCSSCFTCTSCKSPFRGAFYNVSGAPYCDKCARAL